MARQNKLNSVDRAEIVIVGNGIAGQTAALEARRLAPDKRIVLITEQSHPTINTPALKQFAIGKLTREQLLAYPAGTERTQRIHVINARVEEVHAQSNCVCLTGGRGFGYESLLIATGSAATGLPSNLPGRDFDGVLTLHRLGDYLDLRRRLDEVEEAVVIGGGLHAIETVLGLLYWNIRVHWLIRGDTFLPRMLDRPASDMVLERIQRAGARVYTETEVVGIVGRVGSVAGVVTSRHQLLPCQLVLVCTGTTPVTTLAKQCDLPMKHKRGILVDNQLRTSVPGIYAAGDVAALQDPQTGEYAPRPQWYDAVLQGRIAGGAMVGSAQQEDSFGISWHATRLGELSMLTVGNPLQWRELATTLTDIGKGSYRRLSIIDDRLVGYLSLGPTQPDGLSIKRLIDEGHSISDIKKALLKGEFDARKYFSQRRTYVAQHLVNTGKLPSPYTFETSSQTRQLVRTLRETGPLAAPAPEVRLTGTHIEVDTDPLLNSHAYQTGTPPQRKSEQIPTESEALFFEGGIVPSHEYHYQHLQRTEESPLVALSSDTAGKLPSLPDERSDAPTVGARFIAPQGRGGANAPDERSDAPTVGARFIAPQGRGGASAPGVPGAPRPATSSLWSYSDKLPAVKVKRSGGQFIAPPVVSKKDPERLSKVYPSKSLWSYTDKHAAIKKGR